MSGRGFQANVVQFFRNVTQERQDEDDTIDLQVGKTVHSDVPRQMRTELWMSVLRKGLGTAASQQYVQMLAKVRMRPHICLTLSCWREPIQKVGLAAGCRVQLALILACEPCMRSGEHFKVSERQSRPGSSREG